MRVPGPFDFRGQAGRSTFGVTRILGALVLHNIYRIAAASATPHGRAGFGYLFPMSLFYGPRPVSADEQRLRWISWWRWRSQSHFCGSSSYGSVLFLALPFFMGFISAWLYGYHEPRSSGACYAVAMASVFLTGAIIVGIAFEGIICVGMAAPLAIPLALLGARLGYEGLQTRHLRIQPKTLCGLFLVIPLLMGAEFRKPAPVPTHTVHSSVEIAAPPNAVWQRVVAFPRIQERPQWIFRLGMAYPLEVRTRGTGLSADRECVFSTGISREPILAWEESRYFAFRVSEEPPLMQEWSPDGQIHVRHLEDRDFRPGRVDFYLTELPDGRTQLDCWSTYENRMWPGEYWRLWTDEVVRQIQLRVFRHIKKLAEADAQLSAGR